LAQRRHLDLLQELDFVFAQGRVIHRDHSLREVCPRTLFYAFGQELNYIVDYDLLVFILEKFVRFQDLVSVGNL